VAGRCKHCKQDLTQHRAARPQAAAVLPSLDGRGTPMPVAGPPAAGNGTSVHAPVPAAVNSPDSAPTILPQRVTGRQYEAQRPRRSLLRSWPVIVIIVACTAIVTAIVSLVVPANSGSSGRRKLMPAPAPDHMQTSPKGDPWSGASPTPPPAPSDPPVGPSPAPQPRVTPDPPQANPNDPQNDLFNQLGQNVPQSAMLPFVFAARMCKRISSCPGVDDSVRVACDGLSMMQLPQPTGCAAMQECNEAIDKLPCDTATSSDPTITINMIRECTRAISEC
jgi:hypothetical protein